MVKDQVKNVYRHAKNTNESRLVKMAVAILNLKCKEMSKNTYQYPSQKSKSRFNQEKARFNRDKYNFNGINQDLSEILSQQDFIIINLENLGLTRLISVRLNKNQRDLNQELSVISVTTVLVSSQRELNQDLTKKSKIKIFLIFQ